VVDARTRVAAVEVPLAGYVAAGRPIEAIAQPDTIAIPEYLAGRGRTYVLRVKGDSMIEDCIQDGDYVIVEPRRDVRNGEMVIACLNGGEVTLKRFFREPGRVRLQPANSRYLPMYVTDEEFEVQGVVIGVMRRY
jgi:repressor LexA